MHLLYYRTFIPIPPDPPQNLLDICPDPLPISQALEIIPPRFDEVVEETPVHVFRYQGHYRLSYL